MLKRRGKVHCQCPLFLLRKAKDDERKKKEYKGGVACEEGLILILSQNSLAFLLLCKHEARVGCSGNQGIESCRASRGGFATVAVMTWTKQTPSLTSSVESVVLLRTGNTSRPQQRRTAQNISRLQIECTSKK